MITLNTLFIGRFYSLKPYLEGLEKLDFDKKKIHLLWHDTSHITPFASELAAYLDKNGHNYASVTYLECPRPHYHFEEKNSRRNTLDAIAAGYNHVRKFFKGDYFFCLEDDIWCPPDTLKKLLEVIESDPRIMAAAGRVIARPSNDWNGGRIVAWNFDKKETFPGEGIETVYEAKILDYLKDKGIEYVGSAHLGCTLIKSEFIRNNEFSTHEDGIVTGSDVVLGYRIMKQKFKYALDWSIHCKHYDIDGRCV